MDSGVEKDLDSLASMLLTWKVQQYSFGETEVKVHGVC